MKSQPTLHLPYTYPTPTLYLPCTHGALEGRRNAQQSERWSAQGPRATRDYRVADSATGAPTGTPTGTPTGAPRHPLERPLGHPLEHRGTHWSARLPGTTGQL